MRVHGAMVTIPVQGLDSIQVKGEIAEKYALNDRGFKRVRQRDQEEKQDTAEGQYSLLIQILVD